MGADNPRSFSAILAGQRAEFISYREAVTKLSAYCGDPLADVASVLKMHGFHEMHGAFLGGFEGAVRSYSTIPDELEHLLDQTIRSGQIEQAQYSADLPPADPDMEGWLRSRLISELREKGLPCPDTLSEAGANQLAAKSQIPAWKRPFIDRSRLNIRVAAEILAGFDPTYQGLYSDSAESEISAWMDTLIDAVDCKLIEGSGWGADRREQTLSHADIRVWCAERGHDWPLPKLNPQPETGGANSSAEIERLRQALDEAQSKLLSLEQDRDGWRAVAEHIPDTPAPSGRNDELEEALADNARLQSEVTRLSERLVGKGREIELLERTIARNAVASAAQLDNLETRLSDALRDAERLAGGQEASASGREAVTVARQEIERLEKLVPPQPVWLMEIAIAVQGRYWGDNWQPEDKDTWASQSDILTWLKASYPRLSDAQRKAIEAVACPVDRNPSSKK